MTRAVRFVALLATGAGVLALTAVAFGSSGAAPAASGPGAPFVSYSGTCPASPGSVMFTVPISDGHAGPLAELAADGPATLRDANHDGVDTGGAGTVWEPWGTSLSAGDSVDVEVDCNSATDVSFTFDLYEAPTTPFTVSGAATSCAMCSSRNDIRFAAPAAAAYVADLTLTQGSVDLSGGRAHHVFAASGRYDLGYLAKGPRDVYVTPLAGPTATWSLSIRAACRVPRVIGRRVARAKRAIVRAGCTVGTVSPRTSTQRQKGHVVAQKQRPGTVLRKGARVRLWVGGGPSRAAVGGAPSDRLSRSGLVFRYYAGSGWQFQPLLSFEHLNNLVTAHQSSAAQRLVAALLARGERQGAALYWRYDFPFGGPVPWTSGFVQAIAAQALARTSQLLERPALLRPAGAALRGLRRGLLLHVGGGLWIREYGFTRQVILNSQLQSLLSLGSYARLVAAPPAARLVQSLYRATVRLLPRFDLGCRSLYQLGGPVADSHYQDYHVDLLERLAGRYPEQPLFGRLYLRWRRCA